jgi:hypothetical protein
MKLAYLIIPTLLGICAVSHGEEGSKPEPYSLKNRSVFNLSKEGRAPFWPIGWMRQKGGDLGTNQNQIAQVVEAPKFQLTGENFSVTSILLGHPSIAVINGRSFEEGQFLPVVAGDERLRVQVRAIREAGVWLQLDKQKPILVPMRRDNIQRKTTPAASQEEWTIKITRQ